MTEPLADPKTLLDRPVKRSPEHARILERLIVQRGLSYEAAIRECERDAERAAQPYYDAANELRAWLNR